MPEVLASAFGYTVSTINETTIDDKHKVISLLKSIFKDKGFKVIFLGKQEKHVKKKGFNFFLSSQLDSVITVNYPVTGTILIPSQ